MKSKLSNLHRRLNSLEGSSPDPAQRSDSRKGVTVFTLVDGRKALMPAPGLLDAFRDVINHRDTPRARILLRAKRASDGCRIHQMAQALHIVPAPPGQPGPHIDEGMLADLAARFGDDVFGQLLREFSDDQLAALVPVAQAGIANLQKAAES